MNVTYLQATKLHTIRCKTCIWGGQKHIGAYVIKDMPEEQRYATLIWGAGLPGPILVINPVIDYHVFLLNQGD